MRKTGPLIATVLTLGALAGASIAQANSTAKAAPKPAPPAPLTCPAADSAPVPPAADPTNASPLVPAIVSSGLLCRYGTDGVLATALGARDAAEVVSLMNSTYSSAMTSEPTCAEDSTATTPRALILLRYGTLPDVTVRAVRSACGPYLFTGTHSAPVAQPLADFLDGTAQLPPPVVESPAPATESSE